MSTESARTFLTARGLVVEDIPTAEPEKRADLRARIREEEYVIEAKERDPDREWLATAERAKTDGFATGTRDIEPWWTLAKRISHAHAQLIATPADPHAFRLLWIVALHGDDRFVIKCYRRQLLGVRLVFAYNATNFETNFDTSTPSKECYYFEENDFGRYPAIDGAMLCDREGVELLVNHHSPSRDRFRNSHLYSVMDKAEAVVDAEVLSKRGRALMLDTDFDGQRGNGAQQTYIRQKYGFLVNVVAESQFHGIAVVGGASDGGTDG